MGPGACVKCPLNGHTRQVGDIHYSSYPSGCTAKGYVGVTRVLQLNGINIYITTLVLHFSESAMKHKQKSKWKSDFTLFRYGSQKCMLVNISQLITL